MEPGLKQKLKEFDPLKDFQVFQANQACLRYL